ncbi:MAG TPA: Ig-like domain repeat protein [Acidobacteriaceae bacterium]|nr:Ig-like domain repeat protein [Acidobacteriaceae bacterium]
MRGLVIVPGLLTFLFLGAIGWTAEAQVATRTQVSAETSGGGVLSLTANVADVGGAAVSEGSVSFETAKGSLGSVFVQDGEATLHLTNPPQWARSVTAVYHGDAAFAASSASTPVSADAASTLPGFTVTASPSTLSLTPGQFGTIHLTVTSQNGFAEAVNLSCAGLPGQSTCTFNPAVVTPPANGSIQSALQITTMATSPVTSHNEPGPLSGSRTAWALVLPGMLALAGVGAARRKHWTALRVLGLVMLLGAGMLGLSACNQRYGYEHYKPSPNFGTPAGSYTVLISAYSTNGTAITNATSSDASCSGAVCVALTVQ